MSSLEGQTFAGYEIISQLGRGGMGSVYKARQLKLDRLAALKIMASELAADPDFVARFKREATAAASLSHPNIVQVYSAGESEDTHYIAMEFVDGETLKQHIERQGRLDPREAIAITVYVAEALQYGWNRAKLIHRDIKPDNIFLSNTGEVKVGDLGLAKTVGGATTSLTQTGMMMGSPHYISPEQARGVSDIDFRTDIYSLGCTLYHMLTGRPPYEGPDPLTVITKHVNDPPPAIFKVWPTCPIPVALMVGRMLAKQRHERPASYEDLIDQLREVHGKLKPAAAAAPAITGGLAKATSTPAPTPAPAHAQPTPKPAVAKATTPRAATGARKNSRAMIYAAAGIATVVLIACAGLFIWSPWKTATSSDSAFVRKVDASKPSGAAPSDAPRPRSGVLFDGNDTSVWQHPNGSPCQWQVTDGALVAGERDLDTREKFQDFDLHIEFAVPRDAKQGNSGIYLQGRYEVQILDSFGKPANDICCGAIFKIKAPIENASKAPDEWQSFDITFHAARFDAAGAKTANARVSVIHNGRLIHDNVEIPRSTGKGEPESAAPGPIRLQAYGSPVRFRNIRTRPLAAAVSEAGTSKAAAPGQQLQWFGYGLYGKPSAVPEIASHANFVWLKDWVQNDQRNLLVDAARNAGLKVVLGIPAKQQWDDIKGIAAPLINKYRDVVVAVCWPDLYYNGGTPEQLAEDALRLKQAFPQLQRWAEFVEKPRGRVNTQPIPPEIDVVVVDNYFAKNPGQIRSMCNEVLAGWVDKAQGRPVLFQWQNWSSSKGPGLVPSTSPATMRMCAEIAREFKLAGLVFSSYDDAPDSAGGLRGIETNPALVEAIKAVAEEFGFAPSAGKSTTAPQPRQTIDLLALSDPVKDRIKVEKGASRSNANAWERRGSALAYISDGGSGKLAPPVAINARSYEIEVDFERLSGPGRFHVDLPLDATRIIPMNFDSSYKMINCRAGDPWPANRGPRARVVVRLDRGEGDSQDHLTVQLDGKLVVDWRGDITSVAQKGEPHPDFPGQPITSLYLHKDSYEVRFWQLRVFDGEATVLRGAAAATAADADWQNAINLLPLIDPQQDKVSGNWNAVNGELAATDPASMSQKLQPPYRPAEEYDYRVSFTTKSGNADVAIGLTATGRSFVFYMKRFAKDHVIGFEAINGKAVGNGPTAVHIPHLEHGRRYSVVVQVRKQGLKAYLDGKLMVEWPTDYSDMSPWPVWRFKDDTLLGFGCSKTTAVFDEIKLIEISGKGTFTRGAPASASK